jgi:hypothetical protein
MSSELRPFAIVRFCRERTARHFNFRPFVVRFRPTLAAIKNRYRKQQSGMTGISRLDYLHV